MGDFARQAEIAAVPAVSETSVDPSSSDALPVAEESVVEEAVAEEAAAAAVDGDDAAAPAVAVAGGDTVAAPVAMEEGLEEGHGGGGDDTVVAVAMEEGLEEGPSGVGGDTVVVAVAMGEGLEEGPSGVGGDTVASVAAEPAGLAAVYHEAEVRSVTIQMRIETHHPEFMDICRRHDYEQMDLWDRQHEEALRVPHSEIPGMLDRHAAEAYDMRQRTRRELRVAVLQILLPHMHDDVPPL